MWISNELKQQNDEYFGVRDQMRTKQEIEECIVFARLELYNQDLPCGPEAIRKRLAEFYQINPLPSESKIVRILKRRSLTHGKTGFYG